MKRNNQSTPPNAMGLVDQALMTRECASASPSSDKLGYVCVACTDTSGFYLRGPARISVREARRLATQLLVAADKAEARTETLSYAHCDD